MRKLLVDCSFTSTINSNTGIQRVIRRVLESIVDIANISNYKAIAVSLQEGKIKEVNFDNPNKSLKNNITVQKGDILLLIDSTWHLNIWESVKYAKENQAMVVAVIYDLIPIRYSQFCDDNLPIYFKKWLGAAASYCDGFIAISNTVEKDLKEYFDTFYPKETKNKFYSYFLLGADFAYKTFNISSTNIANNLKELYTSNKNIYLIVCTVEPRKNHKYLLDVFDKLWEQNYDVTLNIVGKKGWMIDELINRIYNHEKYNKNLFYFDKINDEELNYCYQNSKMLLFPSFVEGFGLPIIESLNNKLPVLASDIPIHREVGKDKIAYFDLDNINDLVNKIITIEKNGIPDNLKLEDDFKWLNWNESTEMLFKEIVCMNKKFKPLKSFKKLSHQKKKTKNFKQQIKEIPLIGFTLRWIYNLIRLNNLKFTVYVQQEQINQQQAQINQLQEQNNKNTLIFQEQNKKIDILIKENQNMKEDYASIAYSYVSKEISKQAIAFHIKIDDFLQNVKSKEINTIEEKDSLSFLLDDYYLSFENIFRGSREYIIKRYESYSKYINTDTKKALDIACGRAEWVELLQSQNIDAHGVDLNSSMVNVAKELGIKNLEVCDAFEYLRNCSDNSFDLITSFHLIEHLQFDKLFKLLLEVKRVAIPNAIILLETPNPLNLKVSTYEFYKDPTHLNPLPSDIIKFLLEYLGFIDVKVEYLNPLDKNTQNLQNDAQDYLIVAKNS
ncbi:glycosyltransferase [Poseidonibacter antarcticus]|uniref:glycosyltransferase n=1 Tax=Poseidonibacter antarcticus TaxID=2478538 RepID=UPI000EF4AA5B|nr:glycosyltransferase [Poseidonibacter antarcticus]